MQKHIFFYAQAQINVFAGSCIFDAEGEDMPHRERFLAAFGGPGVSVPTDRGKRGQDTKYGFLSPLDSPYLPSDATPFGCASKNEGPTDAFGAPRIHF